RRLHGRDGRAGQGDAQGQAGERPAGAGFQAQESGREGELLRALFRRPRVRRDAVHQRGGRPGQARGNNWHSCGAAAGPPACRRRRLRAEAAERRLLG
ncbi:unnamed protein product, partial [Prorocentrum cordatum]